MRMFGFCFVKALKPALVITLAVTILGAVLFAFFAKDGYVFRDEYTAAFETLDKDNAYEKTNEKNAEYEQQQNDLNELVNSYINKNQKYGEPPPTLPDGLAAAVIRSIQEGENSDSSKREMYAFMLTSLKDECESKGLI